MWSVPFFRPDYGDAERDAVDKVLLSGWMAVGPNTAEFERRFGEYLGGDVQCVAVANCTAALHLAMLTLGIGEGDEVLIPATTFIADYNVVRLVGATPVLVDATSTSNWNMSAVEARKLINSKTRAVMAVHFAGHPFSDGLVRLCEEHDLPLIEDSAHAVGASAAGHKCGTLGRVAAFSFYANKNLSTGEGGMFVSNDSALVERARLLRSHGMTNLAADRESGDQVSYDIAEPGLNYRMTEMQAAIGLVQLAKLDENNDKRARLCGVYQRRLAGIGGLVVPFRDAPAEHVPSYHIMPVLLPESVERGEVIRALQADGIQTSIHYPAMRNFSGIAVRQATPVADEISRRVLTLPLFPTMTADQVEQVCASLKRACQK